MTFGSGTFGGGSTLPALGAVTLEKLEQETARRLGPYFSAYQATGSPTSSTSTSAIMPSLQTNAVIGGPENLWLLRRGHVQGGADIAVQSADRQRLVLSFDGSAGRVVVDRNWNVPMAPGEIAEFHHLDPAQELRQAVLAGLRRCFLTDTISVVPTGGYADTDLTYSAHWITDPLQVLTVEYGYQRPMYSQPFQVRLHQGHVMLTTPAYGGVWVTALRPHWSWVNGLDSDTGPTDDDDVLNVDLDYAAAAAHIEAWHRIPSRMFYAAAGNLQATQEMAAREFTRQSLIYAPPPSRDIRFSEVVRLPLVG